MSGVREGRMEVPIGEGERSGSGAPDGRLEGGREVRSGAWRRKEVVLRLLRGEGLDALAWEIGGARARSRCGVRTPVASREGLKSRPTPVEDRRLAEVHEPQPHAAVDVRGRAARTDADGAQARPPPARRPHQHRTPDELWATDPAEA